MVNFGNHIAADEVQIIRGKASRIHIGYDDAPQAFHAEVLGAIPCQIVDAETELAWRGLAGLAVHTARTIREHVCAILDGSSRLPLSAITDIGKLYLAADGRLRDGIDEIIAGLDGLAVHAGDDVTAFESGLFRGAAWFNTHDHDAIGRSQGLQCDGIGPQIFEEADAYGAAGDAAVGYELIVDRDRGVRGKRETYAFVASAAGNDGSVDTDDLSGQFNERAAGVAWIDSCVGLQEALELLGEAQAAAVYRANDSRGYLGLQTARAADGEDPFPHLDTFRIAQLSGGQISVYFDFDYRQIRIVVRADNLGGVTRRVVVQ